MIPNPWDVGSARYLQHLGFLAVATTSADIGLSTEEITALGVRRISVGGALALAAWTGFMRAAKTLKLEGSFAGLGSLVPYPEINGLFETTLPADDDWGRSESIDPDNVGDIADEGMGHRG